MEAVETPPVKRLDINDPGVFDKWRSLYSDLTDKEQFDFANDCEEKYPDQQHYTFENFENFFQEVEDTRAQQELDINGDTNDDEKAKFKLRTRIIGPTVLEIGGWKSELADTILKKFPTLSDWHNIEICTNAIAKCVCKDPRHIDYFPGTYKWFNLPQMGKYGVCVASHTIEHLSDDDFKAMALFISKIPTVIFEAPISLERDNWDGYLGTHILTMGWLGVSETMFSLGYRAQKVNDSCMIFRK